MPDHTLNMVQSQLLVPEALRNRADALALVLKVSRADVWRKALEGSGIAALERTYRVQLGELDVIAASLGMTRLDLAGQAARERISLADLKAGHTPMHAALGG